MSLLDELGRHRVVPVVVLDDADRADDLGAALVAGGLPVAEVTLRSLRAGAVLAALAARGDVLVGAGTVLTPDHVDLARDAGAGFIVSPGLSADVVRRCREVGLPVIPGVSTATEVMAARELGLDTVKFFPAEASGGAPAVKALASVFPGLGFMPTGGITEATAPAYLSLPAVTAVGGSWMVAPDLLAAGDWDEVTARCAATRRLETPLLAGGPPP
ncbi:bifunctional 4-hydroxy-2-oxoglutarate aldolase/2-dehydro-3-deoxy-phosphogluconate aldolase [Nocardioides lianchengensis]|uniref:2-dehydro-3-deoxy-phosphogluconate aldolase n=1 Tax=Nocardioides lianchengensis TaxID=1045774 RepID=A0A1G6Q3L4_9ACTN|nr:bifunctional 4-hydroxy-2-oxoglutarate aldolase/2-dehydro-3-deoxy-phosphogluconate aldolase [Nocardioides lianchengensis]NYG12078.1 2-dehydro-3-deoxyphosphogluconate aldolase/(4S)-4-hydroxy-2-oxoglutarate aldolase [Nocardioides lianchengensis]SDC86831.1 2-dehydro-3-deoxyphosphogluconate aldolase / (4S)-4-hydroxy-2-oxoglutarate aldolase [Nocardioides lianchengensis]